MGGSERALSLLAKHHYSCSHRDLIRLLVSPKFFGVGSDNVVHVLRSIAGADRKNKQVTAEASLAIAQFLFNRAELVRLVKADPGGSLARSLEGWYGISYVADLRSRDPNAEKASGRSCFEESAKTIPGIRQEPLLLWRLVETHGGTGHRWKDSKACRLRRQSRGDLLLGAIMPALQGDDSFGKKARSSHEGQAIHLAWRGLRCRHTEHQDVRHKKRNYMENMVGRRPHSSNPRRVGCPRASNCDRDGQSARDPISGHSRRGA